MSKHDPAIMVKYDAALEFVELRMRRLDLREEARRCNEPRRKQRLSDEADTISLVEQRVWKRLREQAEKGM